MRKGLFMIGCVLLALCLSGCSYIKLTEKERDRLAEYMAGKLLEYDRHYDDGLIKEENEETPPPVEETAKPEETKEPEETNEPDDTQPSESEEPKEPQISGDLNTVFRVDNVKLTYEGYEECSSYPENAENQYFLVEAGLGKQLLVLEFKLKNTSDSDIDLSLLDSELQYRLILDGENVVKPLKSWLTDDLQFIECKISAGKSADAHLVFEVEDGYKKENARFEIYEGENKAEQTNVLR